MIKLLHTADWHIGQYFFGFDRKEEHLYFFKWLRKTIKEQEIDVLLVSGDIFDNPNPSAQSQKIYYKFLRQVTVENPELQIVITAGNHDSAARLEAPSPLLEEMNIHIRGAVPRKINGKIDYRKLIVPLKKKGKTEAWCLAVPYLRQGDYPYAEKYAEGVKRMYDELYKELGKKAGPQLPIVVMGHLQATGSEISENDRSERTIIGGLECISPETFDKQNIIYTALGHLHKAQQVSGRENVRYAGSPLPMSFSEKNYKQGVNLVEIKEGQLDKIERILFDPPVKLISLPDKPGLLGEVLKKINNLPEGEVHGNSPYLELKILITEPEPTMRNQIEEALIDKSVRLASAVSYRVRKENESKIITYEELRMIDPIEMAEDVFQSHYGDQMPEKIKLLLQKILHGFEI